ncbi:MAG: sigma 54-interacting transcriptional regulator [Hymenobacter sp.]
MFLDEIGELELNVQAKFLRVLEMQQFTKLGDTKPTSVNVRLVAATNRNLKLGGGRGALPARFVLPALGVHHPGALAEGAGRRTCRCWPSFSCGTSPPGSPSACPASRPRPGPPCKPTPGRAMCAS